MHVGSEANKRRARYGQAQLARGMDLITQLHGTAQEVAFAVLDKFPEVIPVEGVGRTDTVARQVRADLPSHMRVDEAAVQLGIDRAKQALQKAYEQIGRKTSKSRR